MRKTVTFGVVLTIVLAGGSAMPVAAQATTNPTAMSEPTLATEVVVRTDVLSGVELTVQEVEPGLLRVLSDGIRNLADASEEPAFDGISAGLDGSVWLFRPDSFFRLGQQRTHQWRSRYTPKPWGTAWRSSHVLVDRDGTLWRATPTEFMFRGRSWKTPKIAGHRPAGCGGNNRRWCVMGVAASGDGSVWVSVDEGGQVARLRNGRWRAFPGLERIADSGIILGSSATGEVFVIEEPNEDSGLSWITSTKDGRDWQPTLDFAGLVERVGRAGWEAATVGPDGTVWMDFGDQVARRVGDRWEAFESPGIGVGDLCGLSYACGLMEVAPDGSLWAGLEGGGDCNGLGHLDPSQSRSWTRYLEGHCVRGLDVAPGGTVWVQATQGDGPLETYAIPAVAAG